MASEVKRAHDGILKILLHQVEAFLVWNQSSLPFGLHRFFPAINGSRQTPAPKDKRSRSATNAAAPFVLRQQSSQCPQGPCCKDGRGQRAEAGFWQTMPAGLQPRSSQPSTP